MATNFKKLKNTKDNEIDFSDIPLQSKEKYIKAKEVNIDKKFELNPSDFLDDHVTPEKSTITIRLDKDIVEFFKDNSSQYQTAINKVLRGYMLSRKVKK
jgi:uncharacterized protein (DUF4415 family)